MCYVMSCCTLYTDDLIEIGIEIEIEIQRWKKEQICRYSRHAHADKGREKHREMEREIDVKKKRVKEKKSFEHTEPLQKKTVYFQQTKTVQYKRKKEIVTVTD